MNYMLRKQKRKLSESNMPQMRCPFTLCEDVCGQCHDHIQVLTVFSLQYHGGFFPPISMVSVLSHTRALGGSTIHTEAHCVIPYGQLWTGFLLRILDKNKCLDELFLKHLIIPMFSPWFLTYNRHIRVLSYLTILSCPLTILTRLLSENQLTH